MILKGFKEKSKKKYLNKLLSERQVNISGKPIKSMGVIINIDEVSDFDDFRLMANYGNILPNNFKIIAFSEQKRDDLLSWDNCYNPKDFGWYGSIKSTELLVFLETKFDVLISYYEKEILELKLITTLSKAELKVGILQTDERINDLIIKTKLKEFNVFKDELFKYLTVLNKIKK